MKYIKYSLLVGILIFSFFISDKILIFVENSSPIMKEIRKTKSEFEVKSVDAIIKDNTIIPGKNGLVVNERESYLKMNDFGSFNETFFVFNSVKPTISVYDNLDKIIIKGNNPKQVSLVVGNDDLASYLDDNQIEYDFIVESKEQMNKKRAEYIDKNLNLNIENKICLVDISNAKECRKKKCFLVMPNLSIDSNTLYKINNIEGGSIIAIKNDVNTSQLKVIINKIKSRDLDIIKISNLLAE